MAWTEFSKDMGIIALLDDEPNDVGGLTAEELKDKFDEGGKALKEYINGTLLAELAASGAASDLGERDGSVQDKLDGLEQLSHSHEKTDAELSAAVDSSHGHANKAVLDGIEAVTQSLGTSPSKVPSEAAVYAAMADMGGGDMLRSTYDADMDGVVDDSERLGGALPSAFELVSRRVTAIDASCTDEQYPTALAVYSAIYGAMGGSY